MTKDTFLVDQPIQQQQDSYEYTAELSLVEIQLFSCETESATAWKYLYQMSDLT